MKKIISALIVIIVAPIVGLFAFSTMFSKKDSNIFNGTALFNLAYADAPIIVSGGEGGGGATGGVSSGGVGADAGGNAAAQGNDSSVGVEGGSPSGGK